MSHGAYPISELVRRLIEESGLGSSDFVQQIGYRNVAKGLRRLNDLFQNGTADGVLLQRIRDAFNPDPAEFERAIDATADAHEQDRSEAVREIEERERRRFKHFIWVHTEDGAHSFFSAMGERQVKVLWFSEGFDRLSKSEQLAVVQRRVREHCQRSDGGYPGFGQILQYRYADTFDTSIVLDTTGSIIDENGSQFLLPEVWLELH